MQITFRNQCGNPKNNRNFSINFHSSTDTEKKQQKNKHAFIRLEPLAHYTIILWIYALHIWEFVVCFGRNENKFIAQAFVCRFIVNFIRCHLCVRKTIKFPAHSRPSTAISIRLAGKMKIAFCHISLVLLSDSRCLFKLEIYSHLSASLGKKSMLRENFLLLTFVTWESIKVQNFLEHLSFLPLHYINQM